MKRLIHLVLLIFATGCGESHFLNQAIKHPEWLKQKDSIIIRRDSVKTSEIHKDTVFHSLYSKDTVFIRENHLTIKYLYKGGDSAFIAGQVAQYRIPVKDSTIIREKTIIQQIKEPLSGFDNFCRWIVILSICFGLLYIGGKTVLPLIKAWLKI